jgi:hypothetical protein
LFGDSDWGDKGSSKYPRCGTPTEIEFRERWHYKGVIYSAKIVKRNSIAGVSGKSEKRTLATLMENSK